MQQRRLRLGDILDDYCPRERRITNHAVVAMIEEQVKQTRCTTCDADHEYKQGKAPSPRRRKPDAALTGEIEGALRPRAAAVEGDLEEHDDLDPEDDSAGPFEPPMVAEAGEPDVDGAVDADLDDDDVDGNRAGDDDGPVHRRLIRATLPRQEGQVPERKPADFTIRQPGGRGGGREFDGNKAGYRPSGSGGGAAGGRGRRPIRTHGGPPGQPSRFGGPRPGPGQGAGQGGPRHGSGQGQRPQGNRPGQPGANRGGGRPQGQGRGPGGGGGRKRGR
jgi:hypothetical protein